MKANVQLIPHAEMQARCEFFADDAPSALLSEASFQQLLALEKKRRERSGNPLLLMRATVNDPAGGCDSGSLLARLSATLFAVTRETDIKGWYADQLILGVICTEIGNSDLNEARDTIYHKVDECLRDLMTVEERQQVEISFDSFVGHDRRPMPGSLPRDLELGRGKDSPRGAAAGPGRFLASLLRHPGLLLTGDVVLVALACFLNAWLERGSPRNLFAEAPAAFLVTLCQVLGGLILFGQYHRRHLSGWREILTRTALGVGLAALGAAVVCYLAPQWPAGHRITLLEAGLLWVLLAAFRIVSIGRNRNAEPKTPALVIGNGNLGRNVCRLLSSPFSPYDLRGCLVDGPSGTSAGGGAPDILGGLERIHETVAALSIRTLIVALPRQRSQHSLRKILEARLNGLQVIDLPDLYERLTGRIPVQYIEDRWLLFADGFSLLSKTAVQRVKRLIDLICAGLLLLLTLPLTVGIALAVRLDSPGPVFYQEERIGRNGRLFCIWNFRTMHSPAPAQGGGSGGRRDLRATRVGRWLHFLHLEPLPQLWNVFKGEMSLVGPSPERPELAGELGRRLPYYGVRHTVSPGITGWARLNYPYGTTFEDALCRLEYDLYYIKNMSILLDLKILLHTVGRILPGSQRCC